MTGALGDRVSAELDSLHQSGPLGLAVSGGGDSIAMLHLAHEWAAQRVVSLSVATIDHRLRPESAEEAAGVAKICARLGLPHATLQWEDWSGSGNLMAEARAARRRLLADWAKREGLRTIALGHTLDDQAETVLMRLGRGSGVDGLSGMKAASDAEGVSWLRPLLGCKRADLRVWLRDRGEQWVDDPSNDDPRFDRIRARKAFAVLSDLGVTPDGVADTASRLRAARDALDHAAGQLAEQAARWGVCGELYLSLTPLRAAPHELQRRLLRAGLTRAAGAAYGPRAGAEQKLLSAILSLRLGGGRSLHGCLVRPHGADGVVITREASAAMDGEAGLWDGRFRIEAAAPIDGARLAALGETGARRLSDLAEEGVWSPPPFWADTPRGARLTTPALFRGEALIAAPIAAYGDALKATFAPGKNWWAEPPAATV